MTPRSEPVKSPRRYDASGRRDRARQAQARVLETARAMFLRDGYAATTVAAVAAAADISVGTIYQRFGGKPGMIRAIHRISLAGSRPVPAEQRSDAMSGHPSDPLEILRGWATLTTEVAPRTAPILLLIRAAAATEQEMAALLTDITDQRLSRMTHNAARLAARGPLRPGLTVDHARDVLFAYTAPELYELLVLQQQWTPDQFGDFVYRGLVAELLAPAPSRPAPQPRPT